MFSQVQESQARPHSSKETMKRNLFDNKKGQFGNLQQMILSLIVIGVIIGVGFLVLGQFQNKLIVNTGTSESWIGTNVTNYSFIQKEGYLSSLIVKNSTSGVVQSTNYVVYGSNGFLDKIILTDTSTYIGSALTLNFNYQDESKPAYIGLNKTIKAMNTIPQWLGIIVLLGIVAILLSILFKVFPNEKKNNEISI